MPLQVGAKFPLLFGASKTAAQRPALRHYRHFCLTGFICLLVCLTHSAYAGQTIVVGNCQFPTISGWAGESFHSSERDSFTQRHDVGSNHIMLKVIRNLSPIPISNPEAFLQQVSEETQKQFPSQISNKSTRYQGRPAYSFDASRQDGQQVVQMRELIFVDKNSTYSVHLVISGKSIDKVALNEANKQWNNTLASINLVDRTPWPLYGVLILLLTLSSGIAVILYNRRKRLKNA